MSAYSLGLKGNSTITWFVDSGGLAPCSPNPTVFSYFAAIPSPLARIFHESLSRDREDGRATRQPSRGTAGLVRGVPKWYVAGADTRGRQEGRPYLWSQQVIHGISGLGAERKLDQRHVIKRATPSNSSIFLDSYFDMIYLILNILYRGS